MKISGNFSSLPATGVRISPELEKALRPTKAGAAEDVSFGDMLKNKIDQVDQLQKAADTATTEFATGKSRNLHEAVLALEMADTSLRMMVTVRNKALEAYQEIMKMPI